MERGRRLIAQNDQPEATSVRRLIDHAMRGPERRICPPLKIPHTLCARVFRSRQRAVQDADAAAGHYNGPLPARGAETIAECRRLWHYQGAAVSLAKLCAPAKVGLVGRQRRAVWGRRLDFGRKKVSWLHTAGGGRRLLNHRGENAFRRCVGSSSLHGCGHSPHEARGCSRISGHNPLHS